MAEIITEKGRIAIKKMAQVSQCVRVLGLMPNPEDFALRLIGDLRGIIKMMNNISVRIDDILERYMSIPVEFLYEGFDLILEKLNNLNDYAKFAIAETTGVLSSTVSSARELTDALGSAVSTTTSAVLQVGGGLTYASVAMGANIKLMMSGNSREMLTNDVVQDVVDGKVPVSEMMNEFDRRIDEEVGGADNAAKSIRDWTENAASKSTESINDFFGDVGGGLKDAEDWVNGVKSGADKIVDDSVGVLIEKVENAKRVVEEKIERVREIFNNLTKNFDESFGTLVGKSWVEDAFRNASNTAYEKMDGPVFDAIGEITKETADFIKNFNIGKVVTGLAGLFAGAGLATLAMDLLPNIDTDKMLKSIIGGVERRIVDKMTELQHNKVYGDGPEVTDLMEIPDTPWRLSKDDCEIYIENEGKYAKQLEAFLEENNSEREKLLAELAKATTPADVRRITKENREKMKSNKSALKQMRKIRRDVIKAKQIKKYKSFLKIELDYLQKEFNNVKDNIKRDWDDMTNQYRRAIEEITKFFTNLGSGGCESIDRCCDRINDDADQIVELCQNITVALTNTVAVVPVPYAIGSCIDMPVHKLLSFFKDVKIVLSFLKNIIQLGVDIVSQMSILAKIVCNGIQSVSEVLNTLMSLIGIDKILNMIDFLVALFRPKMADAKLLLENALSPVYYNETEEYENKMSELEASAMAEDGEGEDLENSMDELEEKGDEIVAYRSPILNAECDDFAGWIYYYAKASNEYMRPKWSEKKRKRKNKVIKRAARKNKVRSGKLIGGVAQLKKNSGFGHIDKNGEWQGRSVSAYDAFYWYTKWTSDPTDCEPDFSNVEMVYDANGNLIGMKAINKSVVSPIQTTANGSLVELSDGRRVFVEGKNVKSGDFVNVDGVKYRVK